MNTLHNYAVERWVSEEPVVVDVSIGTHNPIGAPVLTVYLVPRCEGVVARFRVAGTLVRQGTYSQAVPALEEHYGVPFATACRYLAQAENIAWLALQDRGVEVPTEFTGV